MAVKKNPPDIYVPDDAVVAFERANADKSADWISGAAPSGTSFAWYGRPRGDDQGWYFLTDVLYNAQWTDDLTTGTVNGTMTLDNRIQENGKRLHDMLPTGSEMRQYFVPFGLDVETLVDRMNSGENLQSQLKEVDRYVLWQSSTNSGGGDVMTATFYNLMKYLVESKITVMFDMTTRSKPWSPTEMTKQIAKDQGITLGKLPKSTNHVNFFYAESTSIWDVLVQIWTLEWKNSKRNFFIRMEQGILNVYEKSKNPPARVLEVGNIIDPNGDGQGGILLSATKSETMDGMATGAQFFGSAKSTTDTGTADTRKAVVASAPYINRKAMAKYGRIWFEQTDNGVVTKARLDKTAMEYVKKKSGLTYSASVQIMGLPWLRAGDPVFCNDAATGLVGLYWFKQIDHQMDGSGNYTAQGDLSSYDFTFTEMASRSDLKPSISQTPSGTNAGVPGLDAGDSTGNGTPAEIRAIFKMALDFLAFPESWASSDDLTKLLQSESGFNWTAQGSIAFGMFQFLVGTWAGTGVQKSWATPVSLGGDGGHLPSDGSVIGPINPDGQYGWKFWQAVAGFTYIQNRYGTPGGAWAHKLATRGQFGNTTGWY